MPYIKQANRPRLDKAVAATPPISTPGDLNYLITKLVRQYISNSLPLGEGVGYAKLNEVIGVLESVKLEFYRRAVATYEDVKVIENGDVY